MGIEIEDLKKKLKAVDSRMSETTANHEGNARARNTLVSSVNSGGSCSRGKAPATCLHAAQKPQRRAGRRFPIT